jgi:hypothetical protein
MPSQKASKLASKGGGMGIGHDYVSKLAYTSQKQRKAIESMARSGSTILEISRKLKIFHKSVEAYLIKNNLPLNKQTKQWHYETYFDEELGVQVKKFKPGHAHFALKSSWKGAHMFE